MSDVTCPHCKEDFDVFDHDASGPYECPECGKEIWVEVDYDVVYDAACMDDDHDFQPSAKYPGYDICTHCGGSVLRTDEPKKEGDA